MAFATGEGPALDPDVVLAMDVGTLNALLLEGLAPAEAVADGRVQTTGDPGALDRFTALFAMGHQTSAPREARARGGQSGGPSAGRGIRAKST